MQLDDYRWLVSDAAAPWLDRASTDNRSTVQVASSLRKDLSATRTHLVLEQVELRKRARAKFPQPEQMFFTRKGLEQATDLWVARYKAKRFPNGALVADLCCGIGGDLLALAERGPVVAVDRDPVAAFVTQANADALKISREVRVIAADVSTISLKDFAAWHIDPDRRPRGSRVVSVDLTEPSTSVLSSLLNQNPSGVIKLAPATVLSPQDFPTAGLEWISRDGECRQLVAIFSKQADSPGTRTATVLDRTGEVRRSVSGDLGRPEPGTLGRFVYEPDAAILAAQLTGQIAQEHRLKAFGDGGYLTGDTPIRDGGLDAFEVIDAMPFDRKRLMARLSERCIGEVEVKSRDGTLDANRLQREFSTGGERKVTLLLTRAQKQTWAILAKRCS